MRARFAGAWIGAGAIFLLFASGCGSGGGKPGPTPTPTPSPAPQASPVSVSDFPYSVETPPFVLRISSSRTSGVPGTPFHLTAQVSGNASPIATYAWKGSDGLAASGPTLDAQFATAGDYVVEVTARDGAGGQVTTGIVLKVFDPAATAQVTKAIEPDHGAAGAVVRLTSPALSAPGPLFTVAVPGAAAIEVLRVELGSATFLLPPGAGLASGAAVPIDVVLSADGVEVDRFAFSLSPAPPPVGAPGDLARRILRELPPRLQTVAAGLQGGLPDAGLDASEVAVLRALVEAARIRIEQVRDAGLPVLDRLDVETRALIDTMLAANGAGAALSADSHASLRRTASTRLLAGEEVLEYWCVFQDTMKAVQDAIRPFQAAAPIIALAGLAGGPATSAFLFAFANMSLDLGLAADLAGTLSKICPKVDDRLVVTTSLSRIPPNSSEAAILRVKGKLVLELDPCREGLSKILELLATEFLTRTLPRIPRADLFEQVYARGGYGPNDRFADIIEVVDELEGFLEQVVDKLAEGTVGASQVDGILERARLKICETYRDKEVPIQPTRQIVQDPTPANVGTLGLFGADNVPFTCNPGVSGTATVRAEYPCGARRLEGSVEVTCGEETCTEDAVLQYVTPSFETIQRVNGEFFQCASDPQVKFQPFTHTVGLRFTNRHPSRTVAINFLLVQDSNYDPFDTQRCVGEACDRILGPCFAFLAPSPDPANPPPLATSPQLVYDCEQLERSPVPPGTNLCLSEPLHQNTRVVFQATFCTPESPAKDTFCNAGKTMLQQLQPFRSFPAREVNTCPSPSP